MSITLSALQKQRYDTAANWTAEDPTLLAGEIGVESDTGKIKIGTGATAWTSLSYSGLIPGSGVYPYTQLLMPSGTAGAPSISFDGDVNTGIYSPGADQLALATNGTQRAAIDSSGIVKLYGDASTQCKIYGHYGGGLNWIIGNEGSQDLSINAFGAYPVVFKTNGSEKARIDTSGRLGVGTSSPSKNLEIAATSAEAAIALTSSGRTLLLSSHEQAGVSQATRIGTSSNHELRIITNNTEAIRVDTSQRVGIGSTSPQRKLVVSEGGAQGFEFYPGDPGGGNTLNHYNRSTSAFINYTVNANQHIFSREDGEAARIDGSKRLLVGTSTNIDANSKLQIESDANDKVVLKATSAVANNGSQVNWYVGSTHKAAIYGGNDNSSSSVLTFSTTADGSSSPTERMRIAQNGEILIGNISTTPGGDNTTIGTSLRQVGDIFCARSGAPSAIFNRIGNDGNVVEIRQAGTTEGAISVSGSTVTYGGGHLARWSQLTNNEDPSSILKGTVMSNLDEMCEWGDEDNEQLNKTKVSDVADDPNVAGVFVSTSFDEEGPLDFFVAMTGDMIIRIAEGVTVQRGDLLVSAGDGTAQPQGDRYIKDSTIAKVTSTHVTCTYDDGSYCVPCVLMAC